MSAKAPAKGHTTKHVHRHVKHHKAKGKHHPVHHRKPAGGTGHNVHTAAKPATPAKPAGFALDGLPVCVSEALAMSLRLAGQFVHDEEVVALWEATGASPLGSAVAATLDAANLHGLAGFRPQRKRLERLGPVRIADHLCLPGRDDKSAALSPFENFLAGDAHGLILRIDHPGSHAVLATPDGWWSWGELWSPWPARVCEAWAVSWS